MDEISRLREERGKLAKRIREMADATGGDEPRDFTAEEQQEWDRVNGEYDRLTARQKQLERAEQIGRDMDTPSEPTPAIPPERRTGERTREDRGEATAEQRALATQAWFRYQQGLDLEERHEEACAAVGLNPRRGNLDVRLLPTHELREAFRAHGVEQRLSSELGTGGAVLIPDEATREFEMAMLQFGGPRRVAQIIRTAGGGDLPWPTSDDTGNKGRRLAEKKAIAELDITFGKTVWHAHKYTSDLVKVPVELLEDSPFNLISFIFSALGERIGRAHSTDFTVGGGGPGVPQGIVTGSTLGKTAASATAITADELLDLLGSVDPAYLVDGQTGWMFNNSTLTAIRKLKGSDNNYLWQPGLQGGNPDRLSNWPYTVNQDMPSIAASQKSILFGNLRQYKIRDVAVVRFRRLVERYADEDVEGFVAFSRNDGGLLNAGTDPVKHLIQAA